jgi:hypothetical protein
MSVYLLPFVLLYRRLVVAFSLPRLCAPSAADARVSLLAAADHEPHERDVDTTSQRRAAGVSQEEATQHAEAGRHRCQCRCCILFIRCRSSRCLEIEVGAHTET